MRPIVHSHSAKSPQKDMQKAKDQRLRSTKSVSVVSTKSYTHSSQSVTQSSSEMTTPQVGRQTTNDTVQSHRSGSSMKKKDGSPFYDKAYRQIITTEEVEEKDFRSGRSERRHSRSTSDFASSPRTEKRRKRKPSCERVRKNYIVRAQYVDSHKAMGKYALDRNKSWKKWIQLLQSHHNDIGNVCATAQVQALIDFARISLGSYANWLKMKVNAVNADGTSAGTQWVPYFAVMCDFNIFMFDRERYPASLDEVVGEQYNALSLAHIQGVRQSRTNPTELYLDGTMSERNHHIKFRCVGGRVQAIG